MKKLFSAILFLLATFTVSAAVHTISDIPAVHLTDSTRYVSNPDGVLSPEAVAELDRIIGNIWHSTSAEVAFVVIDDFDEDSDIDSFATDLYTKWGIGKADNDNGLLVLVSAGRRRAALRTGRGMEGVLPDVVCGRIFRNIMVPEFKNGNYDAGTIAAAREISKILTNPAYAEELRSKSADDDEDIDFFKFWINFSIILGVGSLILFFIITISTRHKDDMVKYRKINDIFALTLFLSFMTIGAALPAFLLTLWRRHRIRTRPRKCPNCGHEMKRLDEEHDNTFLTPAQDTEERINSIDYDVWLCPVCNETDIIPYVNRSAAYTECPYCHGRTCVPTEYRILKEPTGSSDGVAIRSYACKNCGKPHDIKVKIAKTAPLVIASGGDAGRGFGGGGGFGGGSFGGGITMGGGASGGW